MRLMLGAVLAALNCWDRRGDVKRLGLAGCRLAVACSGVRRQGHRGPCAGPAGGRDCRRRTRARLLLALTALVPVLLWYAWAGHLIDSSGGSRASAENRAIWMTVLGISALGNPQTWTYLWRFLVVRAFTPPGIFLGIWGLCYRSRNKEPLDLWRVWGLECGCSNGAAGEQTPS